LNLSGERSHVSITGGAETLKDMVWTIQSDIREGKEVKALHLLITCLCNSNCGFCFTRARLPREHFRRDMLYAIMHKGFQAGAKDLVLSGGEPTIHPALFSILKRAKIIGFTRIRIITNGRMLCYPEFASSLRRFGVDEAIISVHSHIPSIQDQDCGVLGGFSQAEQGIRNALSEGLGLRINIVLNPHNLAGLKGSVAHFNTLGVKRFGFLRLMPFGMAWKNKGYLYRNDDPRLGAMHEALEYCREHRLSVNANRFVFGQFRDFPEYMQSSVKYANEVRSRLAEFSDLATRKKKLYCFPDRCQFCFLEDFCRSIHEFCLNNEKQDVDPIGFAKQYAKDKHGTAARNGGKEEVRLHED